MDPRLALDETLNPFDALGLCLRQGPTQVCARLRDHLQTCGPRMAAHWRAVLELFEEREETVALWAFLSRRGGQGDHAVDQTLDSVHSVQTPDTPLDWNASLSSDTEQTREVLHDLLYLPPLALPALMEQGLDPTKDPEGS